MNRYEIRCTPEQTRKAFELGAPLNSCYHNDDFQNTIKISSLHYVEIPTAEQMIGWLEERDIIEEIEVGIYECDKWTYMVHLKNKPARVNHTLYDSRQEATLAAIDAALEYLINNKK